MTLMDLEQNPASVWVNNELYVKYDIDEINPTWFDLGILKFSFRYSPLNGGVNHHLWKSARKELVVRLFDSVHELQITL